MVPCRYHTAFNSENLAQVQMHIVNFSGQYAEIKQK